MNDCDNPMVINDIVSPGDCLNFLKRKKLLQPTDVICLQFILKKIKCKKLFAKCFKYAEEQNALCYHEKKQGNDFLYC